MRPRVFFAMICVTAALLGPVTAPAGLPGACRSLQQSMELASDAGSRVRRPLEVLQ